jgi:hypothetical protein
MATAKHLQLVISGDSKQAESAISRLSSKLNSLGNQTAGMRAAFGAIVGGADPFQQLKGAAENLVGSIPMIGPALQSGIALAGSFISKIRETQKEILEVGKAAKGVGASVEGYSGLLYASGGKADMLNTALFHVSEGIGKAAMEGGEGAEVFNQLGLNLGALSKLSTDEQFIKVADALAKVKNSAERNADAMKLMGRSAAEAMPLINKGEEGIRAAIDRGKRQGKLLSTEDVEIVKQTEQSIKQLDSGWEAMWRTIALKVSPTMQSLANDLADDGQDSIGGAMERGSTLLQLKYMFQDLVSFDWGSGASASSRAEMELANQANKRKQAIEDAKKEQAQIAEAAKQAKEMNDQKQRIAAVDQIIDKANPWGKMEEDIKKVNAAIKDISPDKFKKAMDAVKDTFSKPFIEKAMGPLDKFQKQISDLKDAKQHLGLSGDVFNGNLASIIDQYKDLAPPPAKGPELAEFGSASAFSTIAQNESDARNKSIDIQAQMKSLLDAIKAKQDETAQNTKDTARALENLGVL